MEIIRVVSYDDPPKDFYISQFSGKLDRFFKNLTPPPNTFSPNVELIHLLKDRSAEANLLRKFVEIA